MLHEFTKISPEIYSVRIILASNFNVVNCKFSTDFFTSMRDLSKKLGIDGIKNCNLDKSDKKILNSPYKFTFQSLGYDIVFLPIYTPKI